MVDDKNSNPLQHAQHPLLPEAMRYKPKAPVVAEEISVLDPQGTPYVIPSKDWEAAKGMGFTFAPATPPVPVAPAEPVIPQAQVSDISEDGDHYFMISPDKQKLSIPYRDKEKALGMGFIFSSQDNAAQLAAYQAKVDQDVQRIKQWESKQGKYLPGGNELKDPEKFLPPGVAFAPGGKVQAPKWIEKAGPNAVDEAHAKDDVQDERGNFKMRAPNGDMVLVPADKLLSNRLPFYDQNFQALVDANIKNQSGNDRVNTVLRGFAQNVPGAGSMVKELDASDLANPKQKLSLKAEQIADLLTDPNDPYHTGGAVAGVATNFIPLGRLAGAGSIVGGAGKAVLSKLAPEGAGFATRLGARAAAGAVEGAVISAPQVLAQGIIERNPVGAAESLLLGAGIGGVLGFGGKLLGEGVKAIEGGKGAKVVGALEALGASEQNLSKLEAAGVKQEPFLKSLIDNGLSRNSTPEQISKVLQKVSVEGEGLSKLLPAIDKVAESPFSTTSLLKKIGSVGVESQMSLFQEPGIAKVVEGLAQKLEGQAPKGTMSLTGLQKFTTELGQTINWQSKEAIDIVKKQIFKDSLSELLSAAENSVLKGNAKQVAEFASAKAIMESAGLMHEQIISDIAGGKLTSKMSPVVATIGSMLSSKVTGIAGGVVGGGFGGYAAGKALGGAAEKGMDLLSKYVENPANGSKLTGWLKTNAASQAVGSYMTVDAVHSVASKAEKIAPFVASLSEKAPVVPAIFIGSKDPIKDMLGPEANGLSKPQQFERLSNKVATLAGNPQLLNDISDQLSSPFAKDHPVLAAQLKSDMNNKVQYLHQLLHGGNNSEPTPFKKQEKYVPSKNDMRDMEDQLKIAQNPFALLDGLKNGRVTPKQVATATMLNPAILGQIREEVTKLAYSGKTNLSYQQRLAASIIMGEAMDKSLKATTQLQQGYQPLPPSNPAAGSGKVGKMNPQKMATSQGTLAQRLMGK